MKDNLFELEGFDSLEVVRRFVTDCQKDNHVQQVAFTTYHDALTQICFDCQKIRTNMEVEDSKDIEVAGDEGK